MVPLSWYLLLSAILFACGVAGFLLKRNIITIFMSIELMLNGVNLSFVALATHLGKLSGEDERTHQVARSSALDNDIERVVPQQTAGHRLVLGLEFQAGDPRRVVKSDSLAIDDQLGFFNLNRGVRIVRRRRKSAGQAIEDEALAAIGDADNRDPRHRTCDFPGRRHP